MYYITLYLELNQAYAEKALAVQKRLSRRLRGEVIQIGAVKLDRNMTPCGSYQIIVKPKYQHKHIGSMFMEHFINYSKSNYEASPYAAYEEDYDTHHVIGQEFDTVLILMDKSFYYDDDGVLQGIPHPNPDYLYPNLFYQGISRVREKIALIVVDAPVLFEKITSVLENEE